MTRTRIAVRLCLSAALALTGCGAPQAASPAPAVAFETVGFAEEGAGVAPSNAAERSRIRKYLRRNTVHGEMTVQSRDGDVRTIVVQRGKITAVTDTGITVESTDGYDVNWTYGDPLRVVQNREAAERSALRAGVEVGVGGLREDEATRARLIVIR